MRTALRTAWQRWKEIAEVIARVQAKILMSILYWVVIGPFAVGLRLLGDPLELRPHPDGSRWRQLARQTSTLDAARKQF